jgi:hypothetical protein
VSSWLSILYFGVLAIPLQFALLRQKLAFWTTLAMWALLVVFLYAHFHFHISWTLLGKVGVNAVIPSVMAWAGNYLASASTESRREKRLWRALFIALAVIGIIGSFFVESQMDRDHTTEIIGLQSRLDGIGMFLEKHPPAGFTKEQTSALLQIIGGRNKSKTPAPPQNKFADLTYEELADKAKSTASESHNLSVGWSQKLFAMNQITNDQIQFYKKVTGGPFGASFSWQAMDSKDQPAFRQKREQEKVAVSNDVREKTRPLMELLCDLRNEIVTNRLEPWYASALQDKKSSDLCEKIKTASYGPEEMYQVAHNVDQLQERLRLEIGP